MYSVWLASYKLNGLFLWTLFLPARLCVFGYLYFKNLFFRYIVVEPDEGFSMIMPSIQFNVAIQPSTSTSLLKTASLRLVTI